MSRFQNIITKVTRYNDVFLAALVVLVIGLMIIPVPPALLDMLIACNLAVSSFLLMMSLYIPNVLSFSTFPTLLLFTTLFRLALNITATRLILLHAHAGQIIFTFGNFVVAGNFIVGAVIFLIITIVQFVVITKGAERVAEVGARFTLDAMPGKQMSIDADLRAGAIDQETAKAKRATLERENQLYGAMDGAMKFVKGDAIAGLIIVSINIIAGISIGCLQKGMTIDKALKTYSILTIGDGLVSQIPALLIAITAGIIVTHVGAEEEEAKKGLGGEIGGQFLRQPKALLVAGGLLIALSLIPGFPKIQFLILAALAIGVGYTLTKTAKAEALANAGGKRLSAFSPTALPKGKKGAPGSSATSTTGKEGGSEDFSVTVPLMADVDATLQTVIDPEILNDELVKVRHALYQDLGVPFPGIHLRFNETLPTDVYRILLAEVPMAQGNFKRGYLLARERGENLATLGIPYIEDKPFLPNVPSVWVEEGLKDQLTAVGIGTMTIPQILTYHISFLLKRYAGDFIGLQETKFLLEKMEAQYPEVVREVQRVLPIQKITEVMQRLVQEEISIRNLRTILQALIDWGQKEKETVLLTEYVRSSLRRYISYKFSGGQNIISVYLLEPEVEETLRKAVRQTSAGNYLALDPATGKKLVENIKRQVGDITQMVQRPVILVSMDLRRYLRKLIELELYDLAVLSYQELTEEITVQPLGRISL